MHGFARILLKMEPLNSNRDGFQRIAIGVNGQNFDLALTHNRMFEL